jgi:hypothetical protein
MTVINELQCVSKEMAMNYVKIMFPYLLGRTGENHDNPQP